MLYVSRVEACCSGEGCAEDVRALSAARLDTMVRRRRIQGHHWSVDFKVIDLLFYIFNLCMTEYFTNLIPLLIPPVSVDFK